MDKDLSKMTHTHKNTEEVYLNEIGMAHLFTEEVTHRHYLDPLHPHHEHFGPSYDMEPEPETSAYPTFDVEPDHSEADLPRSNDVKPSRPVQSYPGDSAHQGSMIHEHRHQGALSHSHAHRHSHASIPHDIIHLHQHTEDQDATLRAVAQDANDVSEMAHEEEVRQG